MCQKFVGHATCALVYKEYWIIHWLPVFGFHVLVIYMLGIDLFEETMNLWNWQVRLENDLLDFSSRLFLMYLFSDFGLFNAPKVIVKRLN